ncbi:MAG: hypothetical protein ACLFQV_13335 [Vulcanimicrobiota bacterium]
MERNPNIINLMKINTFVSIFIITAIGFFMPMELQEPVEDFNSILSVLIGISFLLIPITWLLKRRYIEQVKNYEKGELDTRKLIFSAQMVFSLAAAPAMLGLISRIMSGKTDYLYPFSFMAIVLTLFFMPHFDADKKREMNINDEKYQIQD